MPILRVKSGPDVGKTFELSEDSTTIGRECPEGITINDQGASRKHAEIFKIGEMYFVKDLDSKNGTYVNDEMITEEILQIGDKIRIGQTLFVIEDAPGEVAKKDEDAEIVEFDHKDHEKEYAQTIVLDIEKIREAERQTPEGKQLQNLSVIYDIGKNISAEKSLPKLLSRVLEIAGEAIDADAGYVFVKDKKSGKLIPQASWRAQEDKKKSVAISTSIIKRVIEVGKPIMTTDAMSDSRFASTKSVVLRKIRSVIAAPLKSRNIIHGVMYFNMNRAQKSFAHEDLELITSVAMMTATAVDSITAIVKQQEIMFNTLRSLVSLLEERDPTFKGHSTRVMNYCAAIGAQMKLPRQQRYWLELAALLHDLGKLAISADESDRKKRMETAVKACEKLIKNMKDLEQVIPIIKYQYAKFDGSGYPADVTKAEVPLLARILVVAKELDIMTTTGGLEKEGMPLKEALLDIGRNAVKRYDKDVVQALLKSYKNGSLFNPTSVFKNVFTSEGK